VACQPARWLLVAAESGDMMCRAARSPCCGRLCMSVVYLVAYLWVIDAQNGAIAWWYVVLMVLTALSFAVAALGTSARAALTVGLVTSALACWSTC